MKQKITETFQLFEITNQHRLSDLLANLSPEEIESAVIQRGHGYYDNEIYLVYQRLETDAQEADRIASEAAHTELMERIELLAKERKKQQRKEKKEAELAQYQRLKAKFEKN
jgi:hypothetical protein